MFSFSHIHLCCNRGDQYAHIRNDKTDDKQLQQVQKDEKNSLFSLVKYCTDTKGCRRLGIMKFFRENVSWNWRCGDCDNCLRSPEAQHALDSQRAQWEQARGKKAKRPSAGKRSQWPARKKQAKNNRMFSS